MNRGVITISESGTVSMPTDTVWMTLPGLRMICAKKVSRKKYLVWRQKTERKFLSWKWKTPPCCMDGLRL